MTNNTVWRSRSQISRRVLCISSLVCVSSAIKPIRRLEQGGRFYNRAERALRETAEFGRLYSHIWHALGEEFRQIKAE